MKFGLAVVLCSFVAKLHELTCDILNEYFNITFAPFCFFDNKN